MMTAYANVPDAVAAMKMGACDYVAKPVDADEICPRRGARHRAATRQDPGRRSPAPRRPSRRDTSDPAILAFRLAVEAARHEASRRYLQRLMHTFNGNVTRAAAQAGMTRESLHRVLRKYGVRSDDHKMAV